MAFQVFVLRFDAPDVRSYFDRIYLDARVWCISAAVILCYAVHAAFRVHCIPANRKWFRVAKVKPSIAFPMRRNLEWADYMRPFTIFVVVRIVRPFAEHLTVETIPRSIQQRVTLCLRHHGKVCEVVWIIFEQPLIVKYGCRNEYALTPDLMPRPVRLYDLVIAYDRSQRRCCRNKSVLNPAMASAAWIRRGSNIDARSGPAWTIARHHVAVFVPCKMRELIKCYKIIAFALIICPVLCALHRAKVNLRAGRKLPKMLRMVITCARICSLVHLFAAVNQLGKLRICFAEYDRAVVRDVNLTQRLCKQRIRLSATGCTTI